MDKIILLIAFLLVKSVYVPLNKRKSKYYWQLPIDDKIPLIPIFIIPYLGYFVFILITIIGLWNTKYLNNFFITYIISYVIAGLFWYLFPNGVRRPVIEDKSIFHNITSFIYSIDEDSNGFPSAHIFGTLICSYFMFLVFPSYWLITTIACITICLSTLFTKQHYIIDLLGGFIVFVLSVLMALLIG